MLLTLICCAFVFQACNTKEEDQIEQLDSNKINQELDLNKINQEKDRTHKEFEALISKDRENLLEIVNKLNNNKGYFYMDVKPGAISVTTTKGEEFEETGSFVKTLSDLMFENNFDQIIQEESNQEIIFFRTVLEDNIVVFHRLIYHQGELDPETQHDYQKLDEAFYYSCSVGE